MNNINDSKETQLAATCLLISVAEADEIFDNNEKNVILSILTDFFSISVDKADELMKEAQIRLQDSIDIFDFGQNLNSAFDKSDKLDFIYCIFEVAFSDNNLSYLENHVINKIANVLNIHRTELLEYKSKFNKK